MTLYSVYDKKNNNSPVAVFVPAEECAAAMGVTRDSFLALWCKVRDDPRASQKWYIVMEDISDCAESIKKIVKHLRGDMPLYLFSKKCGISTKTLSIIENCDLCDFDRIKIKYETLCKIAEACDVPVSIFFCEE